MSDSVRSSRIFLTSSMYVQIRPLYTLLRQFNVHSSASVIPAISLGLSLSSPHLPPDQLDSFLKRMLVSRISRRVLVEHHIALSNSFNGQGNHSLLNGHVGIIHTGLNMKESIDKCTNLLKARPHSILSTGTEGTENVKFECPDVIVEGHLNTKFAYIREHFE